MQVTTSRAVRRLLVRFDRGEELVRTLESLAATEDVGAAWVRGAGTLTSVELDRHDQARRRPGAPEHVEGSLELLSLTGNVAREGGARVVTLYASVARRTERGVEVLGGRLRSARVFHAELLLECFDDVSLERVPDDATGLSLFRFDALAPAPSRAWTSRPDDDDEDAPDDEPAPVAAASTGVSWADVAAVSAAPPVERPARRAPAREPVEPPAPGFRPPPIPERRRTSEEEFMKELLPEKGDYVQHRQFGLCRVDREDGDGSLVIRLPSGVRKTIRLDFMEVGAPRQEGHKRVFPIRPRRR